MEENPLDEFKDVIQEIAELKDYLKDHPEEIDKLLPLIEALIKQLDKLDTD